MKTEISKQIKSKGFMAGYFLIGFGVYMAIMEKNAEFGGAMIGNGLGILGIRDAQ